MSRVASIRRWLPAIALAVVFASAATLLGLWWLGLPRGAQLLWLLRGLAFGVGAAGVLILAYAGLLPSILGRLVGRLWVLVATLAWPKHRIWLDDDGVYRVDYPDELEGHTYKLGLGEVMFDWERSADSFDRTAVDEVRPSDLQEDGGLPGDRVQYGPERGGHSTYLPSDTDHDTWIRAGEVLEGFRDRALELINEAHDYALREFGGDTSGHSGRLVLMGMAFFLMMGAAMGYVVFL